MRAPEEEDETNPLGIINTLLALQEPKDLTGWLGSNTEENSTKLIKFIVAVRDEYDKLVVDYNQLLASKDGDNTQNEALAEKQGVIRYLQGQVADLTAENDTFCRLQEQAIVDGAPVADPPIVSSPGNNRTSGTIDHEPSLGSSTSSVNISTKRRLKLADPPIFTDGKDGVPVEHWLAKIDGKMTADEDLLDTPKRRMVYVMNRVGGMAFSHLEPRAQKNAIKPWKDSEEMFTYLERVFGDLNRLKNAENEYQTLRQGNKDFNAFWAEFQRLAIELDRNDITLISDLTSKLLLEMQRQLNTRDERPTDLLKYAKRC